MIINLVAGVILIAIISLVRYIWLNRKIDGGPVVRVEREKVERLGKRKAAEREWGKS